MRFLCPDMDRGIVCEKAEAYSERECSPGEAQNCSSRGNEAVVRNQGELFRSHEILLAVEAALTIRQPRYLGCYNILRVHNSHSELHNTMETESRFFGKVCNGQKPVLNRIFLGHYEKSPFPPKNFKLQTSNSREAPNFKLQK